MAWRKNTCVKFQERALGLAVSTSVEAPDCVFFFFFFFFFLWGHRGAK